MKDVPNAKFPFSKNRWIQGDFIPISEGIARFDAEGTLLGGATKCFDRVFNRNAKPVR